MARAISEKSLWIAEQLKSGKSVAAVMREGTAKGYTMYGPQCYQIKKGLTKTTHKAPKTSKTVTVEIPENENPEVQEEVSNEVDYTCIDEKIKSQIAEAVNFDGFEGKGLSADELSEMEASEKLEAAELADVKANSAKK